MRDSLQAQIQENRRRAALLAGGFGFAVFVVAFVVLALVGLRWLAVVPAAAIAAGAVWLASTKADRIALSRARAAPADVLGHARYHNVVEGLCVAAGLPKPSLHVVADDAPNAFAIGRDPRHASVVATTGLLEKLSRIELEGVLAHELSHVKSHDTLVSTLAVALVGVVAPGLVPRAIGTRREAVADVTGVALTRYPPGLISALEKLRDDPAVLRSPDRAIAHLWIEAPDTATPSPPLDERIQALREL